MVALSTFAENTTMKVSPTFEIKIALLGNVSAGKTTVLNALFRDKYGEVSMKRTTAGINFFRISRKRNEDVKATKGSKDMDSLAWSMVSDNPRTAESTYSEIVKDNKTLRAGNAVAEKIFEIELIEDLVEMRPDTKLTIVDIPGINEANASHKYKDYVADKWDTFDCVVAVMDGRQGVNTEEQVDLLKFLKTNLREKKDIPVIILCNKVDDPEDEEQAELVREAQKEVETVFGVSDRTKSLEKILQSDKEGKKERVYPVFIPISAINAFVYQSASRMTLDEFGSYFDKAVIEKLGRDQVGRRKWKKLSDQQKLEEAFKVVSCPEENQEGIEEANFDKFLKALAFSCGGRNVQRRLIVGQMEVTLQSMTSETCIASQVASVFQKKKALEERDQTEIEFLQEISLQDTFWRIYETCESAAFEKFTSPDTVDNLGRPVKELMSYHKMIVEVGWKEEEDSIAYHMKALVRRLLGILFEKETVSSKSAAQTHSDKELSWETLTYAEWENIFRSISLLSFDKYFCLHFGKEKVAMDKISHEAASAQCQSHCQFCKSILPDSGEAKFCVKCNTHWLINSGSVLHHCAQGTCQTRATIAHSSSCPSCNGKFRKMTSSDAKDSKRYLGRTYKDKTLQPSFPEDQQQIARFDLPESIEDTRHFGYVVWKYCNFMQKISKE